MIAIHHAAAQYRVALVSDRAVGHQIITLAAGIDGVQRPCPDESIDLDCLVALGPQLVEFVRVDDDVLVGDEFVAGDDVTGRDFAVQGTGFLVLDARVVKKVGRTLTAESGGS